MINLKPLTFAICTLGFSAISSIYANTTPTLALLSDEQLSATTGQALMSLSYLAPNDAANLEAKRAGGDNQIGFYKLGMEAEIELNANIKRLQLGCGGVNGAGGCDLDFENLSLSGISDTNTGRVASSAKLTNPFLQFAIKNPQSSSTREIVGMRFSADQVVGMLTLGTENSDKANGLNSFSGYMKVQSGIGNTPEEQSKIKGTASTQAAYLDLAKNKINGSMSALSIADVDFVTSGGGFYIPSMQNLPFEADQIVVNGNRQKSVSLSSEVGIPTINLGVGANYPTQGRTVTGANGATIAVYTAGTPVSATVTGCNAGLLSLFVCTTVGAPGRTFNGVEMTGSVGGAKAKISFTEALGFIHKLNINSPMSLSLQSKSLLCPGSEAANVAQKGWWMAVQDPVNFGLISPTDKLSIDPLLAQFAERTGDILTKTPAKTSDIVGILSGSKLNVNLGALDFSSAPPLQMNLADLKLNGQDFKPNCYGSLKFC